jgi:membrane protein DedA with SNARE-associated domain
VTLLAIDVLGRLTGLLDRYGYWIVLFGVMLENAGIPVPGETVLLAAGFFSSRGHLSLRYVIAIAVLGAITGDNCGYWIGRKLGRAFLTKYGRYVLLTSDRLEALNGFFGKHGDKTVAVARFITGFRVFTALFAGASRMDWRKFLLFNTIGAIVWSVTISLLGFFFGQSFELLERWVSGAGITLACIALALVVVKFGIDRRKRARNE